MKTAAKSGSGLSSAIRVSVIFAGLGASTGVKSNRASHPESRGEFGLVASHARCAALSANTICVLDMDRELWARGPGVKPNFSAARKIVVEMLGNAVLSIMSPLSTLVHATPSFLPPPADGAGPLSDSMNVAEVTAKAKVLLEALPYIQDFRGSTFVVKYGGSFMDDPDPTVGAASRTTSRSFGGRDQRRRGARRRQGDHPGDGGLGA